MTMIKCYQAIQHECTSKMLPLAIPELQILKDFSHQKTPQSLKVALVRTWQMYARFVTKQQVLAVDSG